MNCAVKDELEQAYQAAVRNFQECFGEHSGAKTPQESDASLDRLNRLKRLAQAALKELEEHRKVHRC